MGKVLKFPVRAARLADKRVLKRARNEDHPDQLQLFAQPTAQILQLPSRLSAFEHALMLDERAKLCRRALPESHRGRRLRGRRLLQPGHHRIQARKNRRSVRLFTRSLEHNARHFEAHYNLGNLYFDVNDLKLAQVHYEMAAEIAPSFPNLYFNLALVLSINNELAGAISALIRYRELAPAADGQKAIELLETLTRTLAASKNSRKA